MQFLDIFVFKEVFSLDFRIIAVIKSKNVSDCHQQWKREKKITFSANFIYKGIKDTTCQSIPGKYR